MSTASAAPDGSMQRQSPVLSWCMFDWANSAFTTLVVTFIYATYFTKSIVPDPIQGPVLWSRAITMTGLCVAILSPYLGALADRRGTRRRYLWTSTLVCVLASCALAFIRPGMTHAVLLALGFFTVANIAFEVQMVFYNAYLPELASKQQLGRISGYGWGMGYVGGLCCMAVALFFFVKPNTLLPVSTVEGFNVRATNLLVAGWMLVFGLPFLWKAPASRPMTGNNLAGPWTRLQDSLRTLMERKDIARFLLARLLYNDGLVTVFAFGGIYAGTVFNMTTSDILGFGIALNVAAGLGALVFGFMDDKWGSKPTILLSLVALSGATLLAAFTPSRAGLWTAGIVIGLFAGPNQSASRSYMSHLAPADRHTEFFGLFALSGKLTAFAGPLVLGIVTAWAHSMRAGIGVVMLFFVLGGLLLTTVPAPRRQ